MYWILLGSVGQSILQLLVLIFLVRLISPQDFAIVSICAFIFNFSRILFDSGIASAYIQKKTLGNIHARAMRTFSLCVGMVLVLLLLTSSSKLSSVFGFPQMVLAVDVVAVTIFFLSMCTIPLADLQRTLKSKKYSILSFMSYFISQLFVLFFVVKLSYTFLAITLGYLIQYFVIFIYFIAFEKRFIRQYFFKWCDIKDMISFATLQVLTRIFNFIAVESPAVLVSKLIDAASAGIFGRLAQLVAVLANVGGSLFDKYFFSLFSRYQDQDLVLKNFYISVISIIFILSAWIFAFVFYYAEILIDIIFGREWISGSNALIFLSVTLSFRLSYKASESIMKAKGMVGSTTVVQIVYAVLTLLFCFLGSFLGLSGVAAGFLLAVIFNFIILNAMVCKVLLISSSTIAKRTFPSFVLFVVAMIPFSIFQLVQIDTFLRNVVTCICLLIVAVTGFIFSKRDVVFISKYKGLS